MALQHPNINPVAVPLGHWHLFGHDYAPAIHWYGLTYMVAFGLFVWLAGRRAQYPWFAREGWMRRDVEDLLFYGVLGVVLGGRLGYVIFYKPLYYAEHLNEIFAVWNGGMSFHGGMLGVLVAMAFFAWQRRRPRWAPARARRGPYGAMTLAGEAQERADRRRQGGNDDRSRDRQRNQR